MGYSRADRALRLGRYLTATPLARCDISKAARSAPYGTRQRANPAAWLGIIASNSSNRSRAAASVRSERNSLFFDLLFLHTGKCLVVPGSGSGTVAQFRSSRIRVSYGRPGRAA